MPHPKTIVVAINPTASFGKSGHVGPAVVARLRGLGHDVTSLSEPDFVQLAAAARRAIAAEPDAFVVVGGDGMVHLGVNLLAGTRVPLGIVPSGTGNDMARGLGLPLGDAEAAIDALVDALEREPRAIDAGIVSHRAEGSDATTQTWFANVLSAGFDAIVNERANSLRHPKGASRYLVALVVELARLRPIRYRVVLDGVETVTDAVLVAVGNSTSIGGGMLVTPNALVDDGHFDVLVVTAMSRLSFLRVFPSVFKGTHLSDPRVSVHRVGSVRIEADAVVAYADGERIAPLPVDIEMVPGALRILH